VTPLHLTIETSSPEETEQVGRRLASMLGTGSVVALRGELATGKTCLVRGMARHFSHGDAVHSPSFTLVNEYGTQPKLYHLDLYRITRVEEVSELGCAELFDSDGICAVEWADHAERLLPPIRLDVLLEHAGPNSRRLTFVDRGMLPKGWQEKLSASRT
jgi:tRNA threonylcarbamoyladenosine biosynthesis protein TsaE